MVVWDRQRVGCQGRAPPQLVVSELCDHGPHPQPLCANINQVRLLTVEELMSVKQSSGCEIRCVTRHGEKEAPQQSRHPHHGCVSLDGPGVRKRGPRSQPWLSPSSSAPLGHGEIAILINQRPTSVKRGQKPCLLLRLLEESKTATSCEAFTEEVIASVCSVNGFLLL